MTSRTALLKRLDAIEAKQSAGNIDRERLRETVRLMRATVPRSKDEEHAAREAADKIAEWYPEVASGWEPWEFHQNQASVFHSDAYFTAEEAGRGTGETEGKLTVHVDPGGRILGATLVSRHAGESSRYSDCPASTRSNWSTSSSTRPGTAVRYSRRAVGK